MVKTVSEERLFSTQVRLEAQRLLLTVVKPLTDIVRPGKGHRQEGE